MKVWLTAILVGALPLGATGAAVADRDRTAIAARAGIEAEGRVEELRTLFRNIHEQWLELVHRNDREIESRHEVVAALRLQAREDRDEAPAQGEVRARLDWRASLYAALDRAAALVEQGVLSFRAMLRIG